MTSPLSATACPCGSGSPYGACCGPLHDGAPAATAEALMRSRYSAFATGRVGYLYATWHPRTRPDDVSADPAMTWTGLRVLSTEAGSADDEEGTVEFAASWTGPTGSGVLHELSRFERRRGRWVYVDGVDRAGGGATGERP